MSVGERALFLTDARSILRDRSVHQPVLTSGQFEQERRQNSGLR